MGVDSLFLVRSALRCAALRRLWLQLTLEWEIKANASRTRVSEQPRGGVQGELAGGTWLRITLI